MIVSISGCACSGKSTLLHMLQNDTKFKIAGYRFVASASRRAFINYDILINKDSNNFSQMVIAGIQLQDYGLELKDCNNVIFDRHLYDTVVYNYWLLQNKKITQQMFKMIIAAYKACPMDMTFICEPLPLEDNGIRTMDVVYRNEIIALFREYLPKTFMIVTGDKEERFNKVKEVVLG